VAGFYCESLPALSEPARRRVRFSAGRCFLGYQGAGHAEAHAPICQRIAFALQQDGIYVIDNNGSGLRRIWSQGNTMLYPVDWSRTGRRSLSWPAVERTKGSSWLTAMDPTSPGWSATSSRVKDAEMYW